MFNGSLASGSEAMYMSKHQHLNKKIIKYISLEGIKSIYLK